MALADSPTQVLCFYNGDEWGRYSHSEKSLILRNHTFSTESEGLIESEQLARGDVCWLIKGYIKYEIILRWIQEAKLDSVGRQAGEISAAPLELHR